MLAVALEKLQRGELHRGDVNNWKFYFKSTFHMTQQTVNVCRDSCSLLPPAEIRKALNAGTRWADLDPGYAAFAATSNTYCEAVPRLHRDRFADMKTCHPAGVGRALS